MKNKLFIGILILILGLPLVSAGTESIDYQTNITINFTADLNQSIIIISTGDQVRTINLTPYVTNQTITFTSTLIVNLTQISCPALTCNLNQTGAVINITIPESPACPAAANITLICPEVKFPDPIIEPIEPVEPTDWRTIVLWGAVILVVLFIFKGPLMDYFNKKNKPPEQPVKPKPRGYVQYGE